MPAVDLIITNARVTTLDPARPLAGAVAIQGERIVAVGDTAAILEHRGPATRVIDAGGASVVPGFNEAHMHLFTGAAELDHLSLAGVHGLEALARAVTAYAAVRPRDPVLMAQAADYALLGPGQPITRHHLDQIVPDRPFAMVASDHHTMWANTAALMATGLLQGRQLGPGNEIVMGPDGLALGELREMEAFDPIVRAAGGHRARLGLQTGGEPDPAPTPAERAADLEVMRRGLAHAARHGITSIQNMDGNLYTLELLDDIRAAGDLTARCRIPFHFKNTMDLAMLEKASAMAARYQDDWLSSGTVKLFMDGVIDSRTAVMIDPYPGETAWRGEPLFAPDHFAAIATEADRRGLQIAVHAIGDGAVRIVLDGYEAAQRANGARDSRHRVEHLEVIHADDVPRFASLGVLASMQPRHAPGAAEFPLEPTVSLIGRSRWPLAYAWRTMKDAGARVVFATDWPVSPICPLASLQAAVTRPRWDDGDPDQRFTVDEALEAATVAAAYAEFREDRKGHITPGALADLVVLDRDLVSTAPEAIGQLQVRATIAGGRVVYEA